jgi:hypothetical protein
VPVSPLTSLRRRWPLLLGLLVLGAALGVGSVLLRPTTYTAEARLAVGGDDLAAQSVPGFALAAQQLASNYARYVDQTADPAALVAATESAPGTVIGVAASPIPASSIIRVEVSATGPALAREVAQKVADDLVKQVSTGSTKPSSVLAEYVDLSGQLSKAQMDVSLARTDLDTLTADHPTQAANIAKARDVVNDATAKAASIALQRDVQRARYTDATETQTNAASLSVVRDAMIARDDRRSRIERYGLVGAGVGALLALLISVRLDRRRPPRHSAEPEPAPSEQL